MPTYNTPADNFCMAPWVNIHVGTQENLQPCCAGAGISMTLDRLDSYLNHHDLNDVKDLFIQDRTPVACQGCQERDWYSQFLHQAPISLNDFTLMSLDLRWSNTCQLTCMYCNEAQSSSWAALKQKKTARIPIASRIQDRDVLIDFIQEHKSTVKRVSLLGGEPLLIKENIKVLEMLGSDIEVSIFTGLNLDIENNHVYHMLLDMPNVYWTISMENVGEKFEFVRRGASWNRQVENINRLVSDKKSRYTVNFQSQFCVYSATSLIELYEFVQDRDIKINWNWLDYPQELDVANFPDKHKIVALDQLQHVKCLASKFSYEPQIDYIENRITATLGKGTSEQVSKCRLWHQKNESLFFNNALSFESLWPEFAD